MYLSAVGFGVVVGGIYIEQYEEPDISSDALDALDRSYRLLFAGGFLTTLFWVCEEF